MPANQSRAGVSLFLAVFVFNFLTDASQVQSEVKSAIPSDKFRSHDKITGADYVEVTAFEDTNSRLTRAKPCYAAKIMNSNGKERKVKVRDLYAAEKPDECISMIYSNRFNIAMTSLDFDGASPSDFNENEDTINDVIDPNENDEDIENAGVDGFEYMPDPDEHDDDNIENAAGDEFYFKFISDSEEDDKYMKNDGFDTVPDPNEDDEDIENAGVDGFEYMPDPNEEDEDIENAGVNGFEYMPDSEEDDKYMKNDGFDTVPEADEKREELENADFSKSDSPPLSDEFHPLEGRRLSFGSYVNEKLAENKDKLSSLNPSPRHSILSAMDAARKSINNEVDNEESVPKFPGFENRAKKSITPRTYRANEKKATEPIATVSPDSLTSDSDSLDTLGDEWVDGGDDHEYSMSHHAHDKARKTTETSFVRHCDLPSPPQFDLHRNTQCPYSSENDEMDPYDEEPIPSQNPSLLSRNTLDAMDPNGEELNHSLRSRNTFEKLNSKNIDSQQHLKDRYATQMEIAHNRHGRYYTSPTNSQPVSADEFYYRRPNSVTQNGRIQVQSMRDGEVKTFWIAWPQSMYDSDHFTGLQAMRRSKTLPNRTQTPPGQGKYSNKIYHGIYRSGSKKLNVHKHAVETKHATLVHPTVSEVSSKLSRYDAPTFKMTVYEGPAGIIQLTDHAKFFQSYNPAHDDPDSQPTTTHAIVYVPSDTRITDDRIEVQTRISSSIATVWMRIQYLKSGKTVVPEKFIAALKECSKKGTIYYNRQADFTSQMLLRAKQYHGVDLQTHLYEKMQKSKHFFEFQAEVEIDFFYTLSTQRDMKNSRMFESFKRCVDKRGGRPYLPPTDAPQPHPKGFTGWMLPIWILLLFIVLLFVLNTLYNVFVQPNSSNNYTRQHLLDTENVSRPVPSRGNGVIIGVVCTTAAAALGAGAMAFYRYHSQTHVPSGVAGRMAAAPSADMNSASSDGFGEERDGFGEEPVALAEKKLRKFYY
eukprot:638218_1